MTQPKLSDRQFGLMFAAVFSVIAVVGWFFFAVILESALIAAGGFTAVALALPGVLLPFNRLWGLFAERLGRVMNFLLLGLFFYLFLLPIGFIIRLSGRDPMHRNPDPKAKTYWTPVTRHSDEDTFRDMF
ncbi:MAG: hypothetical protein CMM60_00315 [Rhodospirillaceae bacterium]|jgi:hypothetical protein|nr:hypothetical protein [Rhodospirillaceae bacterium]|tara:strand:+ start:2105 stop:2494 length:390 start_codon:yes stop_codon:yes gene_type:complete